MTQPQQPDYYAGTGQPSPAQPEQLGYQPQWQAGPPHAAMQPVQQPGMPAPMGTLRFTQAGSFWTNSFVAPTVLLDGYRLPVTSATGSFDFPVPAGGHRLHAHNQWMTTYGNADIDFVVQPGQVVEVFYAAPMNQFIKQGNIGFTPQKKGGAAFLIAMLAVVAVLVLLAVIVPIAASL